MEAVIITFTKKGCELGTRIREELEGGYAPGSTGSEALSCRLVYKDALLPDVCRDAFERSLPLVFVGAAGIAVRSIAPFVKDKLSDPPVIVIDELGRFVIPLLSGHIGGANELALRIAAVSGAIPVITTATDINEVFAVDLFAKENGLSIMNREGIARVSSAALEGRAVTLSIQGYPPQGDVDVLVSGDMPEGCLRDAASIVLCPKKYALGMGCRRGKSFEELRAFAEKVLYEGGIDRRDVGCIATIDIKKDEEGLRALSQAWRLPLIAFDAELLAGAEAGQPEGFSHSELVLERTGVDNVCERAAVLAAGAGAELRIRKTAQNGMTAAVAARRPS